MMNVTSAASVNTIIMRTHSHLPPITGDVLNRVYNSNAVLFADNAVLTADNTVLSAYSNVSGQAVVSLSSRLHDADLTVLALSARLHDADQKVSALSAFSNVSGHAVAAAASMSAFLAALSDENAVLRAQVGL